MSSVHLTLCFETWKTQLDPHLVHNLHNFKTKINKKIRKLDSSLQFYDGVNLTLSGHFAVCFLFKICIFSGIYPIRICFIILLEVCNILQVFFFCIFHIVKILCLFAKIEHSRILSSHRPLHRPKLSIIYDASRERKGAFCILSILLKNSVKWRRINS